MQFLVFDFKAYDLCLVASALEFARRQNVQDLPDIPWAIAGTLQHVVVPDTSTGHCTVQA
eukprot:1380895-Rhodomonas_salina.2